MPSVAELLAALPDQKTTPDPKVLGEGFEELYKNLARRPVPTGRFHRSWKLGGLQARIGLAYLAYWLKSWYQSDDRRQRELMETHLQAALKLLETMGYLRGAIMKIGQILASFPDLAPDEFVDTLACLHFEAPPLHYSLVREQLVNEFRGDPAELFDEFETEAFAAASLGQVHRARLKSGEQVAIKIQYPGMARTIRSDFRNLIALMAPLRLSKDWENLRDQIDDIRKLFELETDYEKEATFLRAARALFNEDDGIIVPRVYDQYSTRRVLTMEYIDGLVTHEFIKTNPSREVRDSFGAKIYRAGCRLFARSRVYHSDAHPGNFIFCDDGQLGLIDFGASRVMNDDEWQYIRGSTDAMLGTRDDVLAHIQRGLMLTDDEMKTKSELVDVIAEFCDHYWKPLRHEGPFDFSDPRYLRNGFDLFSRAAKHRHSRQRPESHIFHRGSFELAALFFQLDARVDCKRIWEEEFRDIGWL